MDEVHRVFIGLGSNLGDKQTNILVAYQHLEEKGYEIINKSSFYVTPPWKFEAKEDFINTIIEIKTTQSAEILLSHLKGIEHFMGRKEKSAGEPYKSRIIDLDIIDYNGTISESGKLILPHPYIEQRNFVLCPLNELDPNWIHPKLKVPIGNLISALDLSDIRIVNTK